MAEPLQNRGSVEGGIPLAVAGLIFAVIMLRSNLLGKATCFLGILANGTGLAMYINAAVAPAMSGSPLFAVLFLFSVAWYFLTGLNPPGKLKSRRRSKMLEKRINQCLKSF